MKHCLSANTSQARLFQYVGTAATARDVVAMADQFDGAGSPVHYLGIGQGTVIGSYLMKST